MPVVKKENEPFDVALRRFKRSCEKAGVLSEVRRRELRKANCRTCEESSSCKASRLKAGSRERSSYTFVLSFSLEDRQSEERNLSRNDNDLLI